MRSGEIEQSGVGSEHLAELSDEETRCFTLVVNALYNCEFTDVLKPESYENFTQSLTDIVEMHGAGGIGEFIIQLYLANSDTELSRTDVVTWLAIHYNYAVEDDEIRLQSDFVLLPDDRIKDTPEIEELAGVPTIALTKDDLC